MKLAAATLGGWLCLVLCASSSNALLGGGVVANTDVEPCAAPFLEMHRRLTVDGRADRLVVLAQNCHQLRHVPKQTLIMRHVPLMLFCGERSLRGAVIASKLPFGSGTIILIMLERSSLIDKLEELFEWMISSGSKNIWASHFMIKLHGDGRDAEDILKIAWAHRILKVTVAVSDAPEADVKFFRTMSLSGGICEGDDVPKPKLIGYCKNGNIYLEGVGAKEIIVQDLQSCPVNIVTIHFPPSVILFPGKSAVQGFSEKLVQKSALSSITVLEPFGGIEVQIINAIAKSMNFSPQFYMPPDGLGWGVGQENGSFSGLQGELASGRAEIGIGCLMPLPIRNKFFVMTRSYGHRGLAWAVPRPKLKPQMTVLVEVFTPATWTVLAAALAIAVCGIVAFKHQLTDGALLYIWATTLGVSVVEMPRASWTRMLLLGWLLAFLVLSAAYQGALFSFLAKPRYQKALETLEDIVLNELPIIAHPNFNTFLETGDSEISAKALSLYQPSADNVLGQMEQMAIGGKEVACLINKEMLIWYNYENRHKGTMVHIVKEMATSYPTMSFLRKNTPLEPRINVLISRLVESGLVEKWYTDLTFVGSKRLGDAPQVLTMYNLSGIFLAQSIGLSVSFLIFLLEILISIFEKRRFIH